ncbi:MAG: IS91 family transposase [Chitinivibrionales bacterium]|nr:IS91 family transposase [Chitinivibrionales bacterium]
MSGSLPQLQEQALHRSDEFCARYIKPHRRHGRKAGARAVGALATRPQAKSAAFYRPRDHEASPLFQVVREHFDEFEKVYPERYQKAYGYWRPVIRSSIDKFMKCGDLKEGFARVRCPNCKAEIFVAFSCRTRCCCPSCGQKRALLLAHRLNDEVLADVPHRQWVFTIPRRLRVYFRYDRSLLVKLCHAAWETVQYVYALEVDGDCGVPAMVGAVQSFGSLINWNSHVHGIVPDGVFTESGHFVHIPDIAAHRAEEFWHERVFALLLDEHKINDEIAGSMRGWKHSGFSVDTSVRIERGDKAGMQRLVEYVSRCPFSLARMVSLADEGKILYRASHANCVPFPISGDKDLMKGIPRNFEVFDPLDFLAAVTQHIPDKGDHTIHYFGWYSNKTRGMQRKKMPKAQQATGMDEPDTPYRCKSRMTWAALIKAVYECDPLKCPKHVPGLNRDAAGRCGSCHL